MAASAGDGNLGARSDSSRVARPVCPRPAAACPGAVCLACGRGRTARGVTPVTSSRGPVACKKSYIHSYIASVYLWRGRVRVSGQTRVVRGDRRDGTEKIRAGAGGAGPGLAGHRSTRRRALSRPLPGPRAGSRVPVPPLPIAGSSCTVMCTVGPPRPATTLSSVQAAARRSRDSTRLRPAPRPASLCAQAPATRGSCSAV